MSSKTIIQPPVSQPIMSGMILFVAMVLETVQKVGVLWDRPVVVAGSSG
jgi:hypothetical protein